ncbi:MAG: bis(5'-nucleosyl)-tetraphosphatase (symmetrical) YqeK [Lachnospiraceae bacterium]|nr:bis(5'-nucleosyl)-tetraphosphatase (symmetrical) YqeK [Lachnospiraceae bacterium]
MEETLSGKRFQHTLGVAYTATAMAMKYDVDVKKALIAGLLHDCAKCMSDEKLLKLSEKENIEVTDVERRNPYLLHAKVGAMLASKEYGIDDEEILDAITYHTTGRPGMTDLDKIVFVADYIEPGRDKAPNLAKVRKLAFEDLDETVRKILKDTLKYLEGEKGSDSEIDPMTAKTYEYYQKKEK